MIGKEKTNAYPFSSPSELLSSSSRLLLSSFSCPLFFFDSFSHLLIFSSSRLPQSASAPLLLSSSAPQILSSSSPLLLFSSSPLLSSSLLSLGPQPCPARGNMGVPSEVSSVTAAVQFPGRHRPPPDQLRAPHPRHLCLHRVRRCVLKGARAAGAHEHAAADAAQGLRVHIAGNAATLREQAAFKHAGCVAIQSAANY